MRRFALPCLLLGTLAACSTPQHPEVVSTPGAGLASYVAPGVIRDGADAAAVATAVTEIVQTRLPAGSTAGSIRVEPPSGGDSSALGDQITEALTKAGYRPSSGEGAIHSLSYQVTSIDGAVLAAVGLDGRARGGALLQRSQSGLQRTGAAMMDLARRGAR